jgi:hypothetical protein
MDIDWNSTFKQSEQLWLQDSLNLEKIANSITFDWSLASFVWQSSFINQYLVIDSVSKISYLDTITLQSHNYSDPSQLLFNFAMSDNMLNLSSSYLTMSPFFQSEYQDMLSTSVLVLPELSLPFSHYFGSYHANSTLSTHPAPVFDAYSNNSNFFFGEGYLYFFLFFSYITFVVYFFVTIIILRWTVTLGTPIVKYFYYFFSVSRETRMQFEVVLQTIVLFLLYWGAVLMTFDDDQEEVIEFIDTQFFLFFTLIILYLIFKHSTHYFSFLESSLNDGRSAVFLTKQFFRDILNTFSLMLRFYVLLFRINVYDMLDDVLDSYYIFIGDFDDDEYFNELFYSIHGTLFFTNDNQDDRSFLLEDENTFSNDLFYSYFVVWGKLNFFLFFLVEETARLGLAFYISFLIIFEVHSVNCSYKEDTFFERKKNLVE